MPDFRQMFSPDTPDFKSMFAPEEPSESIGDVGRKIVQNLPGSAAKAGLGLISSQTNYLDLPRQVAADPHGFAKGLINHFKQYTSLSGAIKALEDDPVGTTMDIAGAMVGGVAGAGKLAGLAPELTAAESWSRLMPHMMSEGAMPETGLKAAGAEKLNLAKQSTDQISNASFQDKMDALKGSLKKEGYRPNLHDKIAVAIDEMEKQIGGRPAEVKGKDFIPQAVVPHIREQILKKYPELRPMEPGKTHTFADLDEMRQMLKPLRKSGDEATRLYAYRLKDALDEHATDQGELGKTYKEGLRQYAQGSKLEEIEDLVDRAQINARGRYSQAGLPHAIAQEFKKIATNPKKLRLWTPDEQARIKTIGQRGELPQRIAGTIAKLSVRGPVTLGADAVVGHLLHAIVPMGGLGLAVTGEIARQAERAMAMGGVEKLRATVEAGGKEENLGKLISPKVLTHLRSTPGASQAIDRWLKKATPAAARTLAVSIARALNTPTLVPRIEKEINDLDNQ